MKKLFILVFGLAVAMTIHSNLEILPHGSEVVSAVADAPTSTVALVFGGGMKDATTMSEIQEDRVIRGIELYKAGKVEKLMMTGDDGARVADEVHPMREYAIVHGVPADDILIDPHGYRTYESCYRARHVYGISQAIAVSQRFHLPRILYMCNTLGVKTAGVAADLRAYPVLWKMELREVGARLKGWWQIEVTKPTYDEKN
jgi:vancomycin permeability regulator SanA